jgi:hypothetical protein
MRVYIAGPMTGFENYNLAAFREAQARWIMMGWDAITPFEANDRAWRRHYDNPFVPGVDKCDYGDPLLNEMFAEDLLEVCTRDAIALLPGWEKSKGTSRELAVALLLGKPIYDAMSGNLLQLQMVLMTFNQLLMTFNQYDVEYANGLSVTTYPKPLAFIKE